MSWWICTPLRETTSWPTWRNVSPNTTNHPKAETQYSFSAEDVKFFFQHGEAYSKAPGHVYEYVMSRTPETLAADSDMVLS